MLLHRLQTQHQSDPIGLFRGSYTNQSPCPFIEKDSAVQLRSTMRIIILNTLHSHYIPGQSAESIAMPGVLAIAVQGLAELKAKQDAEE